MLSTTKLTEGHLGHAVSVSLSSFQVLLLSFSLCSASWLICALPWFSTRPICLYLTSFRVGQTSKWKSQEKEKASIPTASQQFLHFSFSHSFPYPTSDLLLQHSLQSVVLSRAPPRCLLSPQGKDMPEHIPSSLSQSLLTAFLLQLHCSMLLC